MVVSQALSTIQPEGANSLSRRPKSPPERRPERRGARAARRSRPGRIWLYGQHAGGRRPGQSGPPLLPPARHRGGPARRSQPAARARGDSRSRRCRPSAWRQLLPPDAPHQGLALGGGPAARARRRASWAQTRRSARWSWPWTRSAIRAISAPSCAPPRPSAWRACSCPSAAAPNSAAPAPRPPRARWTSLPLVEVVNLARALAELKQRGYWIVGLDAAGTGGAGDARPAAAHRPGARQRGRGPAPAGGRAVRPPGPARDRPAHGKPQRLGGGRDCALPAGTTDAAT